MVPGPNGALLLYQRSTSALHYAHYKSNQIKVMCGNNTMDFPSTYGLSLSSMTQERGTCTSSNMERLVDLSTHMRKGHALKELSANVRLQFDVWDAYVCARCHAHACANPLHCIYLSRLKNSGLRWQTDSKWQIHYQNHQSYQLITKQHQPVTFLGLE